MVLIQLHILIRLINLQRLAINLIASPLRTSPSKGLEIALGIPPLDFFLTKTALTTYFRIQETVSSCWSGLSLTQTGGHLHELSDLIKMTIPEGNYDFYPGSKVKCKVDFDVNNSFSNVKGAINIYTDGSKNYI